jgi:predicted RNA-binding Zn ribbon-like protein
MESRRLAELDRIGGDLALDFSNTLGGAVEGPWDDEWLPGYDDLVDWASDGGLVDAGTAAALRATAAERPDEAAAAHAAAQKLRDAIYAATAPIAHGEAAPPDALAAVAAAHREALSHAELASIAAIDWRWPADDDLRRPLWPVALAAVDLLRDGDRLARLKQCRHCRWLFLDGSRNRSRRWCSMGHCGTDAKVRQLRERRARAGNRPSRARSE